MGTLGSWYSRFMKLNNFSGQINKENFERQEEQFPGGRNSLFLLKIDNPHLHPCESVEGLVSRCQNNSEFFARLRKVEIYPGMRQLWERPHRKILPKIQESFCLSLKFLEEKCKHFYWIQLHCYLKKQNLARNQLLFCQQTLWTIQNFLCLTLMNPIIRIFNVIWFV